MRRVAYLGRWLRLDSINSSAHYEEKDRQANGYIKGMSLPM